MHVSLEDTFGYADTHIQIQCVLGDDDLMSEPIWQLEYIICINGIDLLVT